MGSFVSKKPVRVEIDERKDEYIEVKPKLSAGERAEYTSAVFLAEFEPGSKEARMSMAAGLLMYKMLEMSIIGWRLFERHDDDKVIQDESGHPKTIAFDRALIPDLDLDDPLVDAALQRIVELNPTLLESKEKSGSSPSEPITSESTKPGKAK